MICKSCCIQDHKNCRYPANCPCQHFPSDQVQIVGTQKCEKIFRNISGYDAVERPIHGGVTHSLQPDVQRAAADRGVELEEESKPLDMDVLNRLFSAVAHLQA